MAIIRLGVLADLPAASDVYRSASLSNAGDRDNLMTHPEHLVLAPEGLAEGRTYVAEKERALIGFATWIEAGGVFELEDLFVDPGWRRRGIAAAAADGGGEPGPGRQLARRGEPADVAGLGEEDQRGERADPG